MNKIFNFFKNMRWKLFLSYFILVIFNISLLGFLFYIFTMGHFMATRESYIETAADYFVKFVTANMENDGQLTGTSKFFLRQNWEKMDSQNPQCANLIWTPLCRDLILFHLQYD